MATRAGVVTITVQGQAIRAHVVTDSTRLVLEPGPPISSVDIFDAPPGGAWHIDAVEVTPTDMRIVIGIELA